MRKFRKLFALLLALSLLLLVGCGQDEELDSLTQMEQENDM